MGRKKLKLTYISDDTVRKAAFKHKKIALKKKIDELRILCDVDVCAIFCDPSSSDPEPPVVWPSSLGVNVIKKFEMLPDREKMLKSVNHGEFLNQEIAKIKKKSQNLDDENKESYMRMLMFGLLGNNMEGLSMTSKDRPDLYNFINQYLNDLIDRKISLLSNPHFEIGESSSTAMAMDMAPPSSVPNGSIFTFPQVTKEMQSIISSNQGQEHANSFVAMPAVMAPLAMTEGSSSVPYGSIFTVPQVTKELQSIISSNQGQEHVNSSMAMPAVMALPAMIEAGSDYFVNLLESYIPSNEGIENVNFFATNSVNATVLNSPQVTGEFQPHDNSLASAPLTNSNEEVCIPVMNQDEFNYPNPNQNLNPEFVEEMMKLGEQTGFPWMEEDHLF